MFRRLDRYVLREILGPLALGLLVYTMLLMVQQFFSFADWIIKRGIPAPTVGRLMTLLLPSIVTLTLPMALLLGVLLGMGRLASDSELVALRASGISIYRLLRPVLLLSLVLALLNSYLMLVLKPAGNEAFTRSFYEASTRTLGAQFEPQVFYNEFEGQVLYVLDAPPRGGDWQGVFLADSVPGGAEHPASATFARRGRLELAEGGELVLLRLEDAVQHTYDVRRADRYETRRYESLRLVLKDRLSSAERERVVTARRHRNLDWAGLDALERDPQSSPEQRVYARIEKHKMLAIPAACVVLGLLAVPLGFNNRRGGKSSGFALSIGVVVLYHLLITQGEQAAVAGKLSAMVAMWLPNLLLGAIAVWLLWARNRDRPALPAAAHAVHLARRAFDGLFSWALAARARRRARRDRSRAATPGGLPMSRSRGGLAAAKVVLRLQKPRLWFPNLLDRYVLRRFVFVLGLVLVSALALRVVADFTENIDDILKHRPPTATVVRYYKYQALQMAFDVSPLVVLVTTLVTFSLLARTNEITACRASGVSLYRLALPALAGAGLVALMGTFLQAQVLPASNQKVAEAKDRIKGRPSQRAIRSADRQWMISQGRFIFNFLSFDERRSSLHRLQVFELDPDRGIVARLMADEATSTPDGWVVSRGWARTFDGREQLELEPIPAPARIDLPEPPEFFATEPRRPSQMTFGELSRYVEDLRESGQPQPKYEVALHNKVAFPVGAIVMSLVGLPFAFRIHRRGALYGLGLSIVLGIVFLAVYALFSTLGEVGALPAGVAVWSPSVIFGLLSGYLFLGVRS